MSKPSGQTMVAHLESLGLQEAISDTGANVDGYPSIVLRWNGQSEWYTGFDIYLEDDEPYDPAKEQYREWLVSTFK